MKYQIHKPSGILSNFIKYYWTLESAGEQIQITKERILPDGCIELIFYYCDTFKLYSSQNSSTLLPESFIHGQLTKFIDIEPTGKVGIISVRFQPGGLQKFVRSGMYEFTDTVVSTKDIWGTEGRILEDKIKDSKTNEQRIAHIEQFLISKLSPEKHFDNLINSCIDTIVQSKGRVSSNKLSTKFNISLRQLERVFKTDVGLSPKSFSRIVRFQNTLHLLNEERSEKLAFLANDQGFYDQAHFIKDFKEIAGMAPTLFISNHLTQPSHF